MYQSYFGKNAFENFQKILQFVYYSDFPILGEEIPKKETYIYDQMAINNNSLNLKTLFKYEYSQCFAF